MPNTMINTMSGTSKVPTGTLIIKPLTAKLTRNTETFSRMDPFVRIALGSNIQQTHTHIEGGTNPCWNEQVSFKRMNEDVIIFEVWDNDFTNPDDLVGTGEVAVSTVFNQNCRFNDWINLRYKNTQAGQLLVDIQFIPDSMQMGMNKVGGMGTQYGYTQPMMPQQIPTTIYPTAQYSQPMMVGGTYPKTQQLHGEDGYMPQQPIYQQPVMQPGLQQPGYQQPIYQQQPLYQQQQQPIYQQQQPIYQQQPGYQQGFQQPYGQQQFPKYH